MTKMQIIKSDEYREKEYAQTERLVKKLYIVQGLFIDADAVELLTEEIIKFDFPFKALDAAFQTLYLKKIKSITLELIVNAVEEIPNQQENTVCKFCGTGGTVFGRFVSENNYPSNVSIACCCETGTRISKKRNMRQWNGDNISFDFAHAGEKGVITLDLPENP